MAILALGKARSPREPNLGCRGADRTGWYDALPKKPAQSCRMGRRIVVKLTCPHGHCKCNGHTVHKLSQWHLTANWLALRESVHGCAIRSPLTGCQVTSRPCDQFSRYSKWLDTFQTALIHLLCNRLIKHLKFNTSWMHNVLKFKCSYHKENASIQKLFHQTTHDYRLVNEYNQSLSQESTFFVKVKLSLSVAWRRMEIAEV